MKSMRNTLSKEIKEQVFCADSSYAEQLERLKTLAAGYAEVESAIAVLSDMKTNRSYIYYGKFVAMLDFKPEKSSAINSIWEEEIFQLIHPDDLEEKYIQELRFFTFIKKQPKNRRNRYYMCSTIRMRGKESEWITSVHRVFYYSAPGCDNLWLALCLYLPKIAEMSAPCVVVDSATGQISPLSTDNDHRILTRREKEVLMLIEKGLRSADIASQLNISVHTVSRHRQDLISKLQVRNTIEAIQRAKTLRLI